MGEIVQEELKSAPAVPTHKPKVEEKKQHQDKELEAVAASLGI